MRSELLITQDGDRITPQWNMAAMQSAVKKWIDDYNGKLKEAKDKGTPLTYPTGSDTKEEYKPIHSNARATMHNIVVKYVKQLNHAVMATLGAEEPLPGFRTYTGSLRHLRGCSDRTIQNHKKRLTEAGLLQECRYLGKSGQEMYFHPDVLFNGQADYLTALFRNSTYYPAMGQMSPAESTEMSAKTFAETTTQPNPRFSAQQPDSQSVGSLMQNIMGVNFSGVNALPSGSLEIKDRLSQSGVPSEQVENQEQDIRNIGDAGKVGPPIQTTSPEYFAAKTGENGGAGAAAENSASEGKKARFNKKLGTAGSGPANERYGVGHRDRRKQAPSPLELRTEAVFFIRYLLAGLYTDCIFNDAEREKFAQLAWETCFWHGKTISTLDDLKKHCKMLIDRVDGVIHWKAQNPHFIIPHPTVYLSGDKKCKFNFARTYNWWVKNQTTQAIAIVKREITLHRAGKGIFKGKTLTELYRIHEHRISNLNLPHALEHFKNQATLLYRLTA